MWRTEVVLVDVRGLWTTGPVQRVERRREQVPTSLHYLLQRKLAVVNRQLARMPIQHADLANWRIIPTLDRRPTAERRQPDQCGKRHNNSEGYR